MHFGRILPRFVLFPIFAAFPMLMASLGMAGTINVSGSWRVLSDTEGSINLVGDRGFTVNAFAPGIESSIGPLFNHNPLPGQTINVSSGGVGTAFVGTATLEGDQYALGGLPPFAPPGFLFGSLSVSVSGMPVMAPPLDVASIVMLTNPVHFEGQFFHIDAGSIPALETLLATGTATISLERDCIDPPGSCWQFKGVTYDLTPTPEPITLLLLGSTFAGAGLAAWRKRQRRG